ncbi:MULTISPECIES: IclR family transcriptional regulator [Clostridia]|uniref:IclR family transcriptional regulator n=1 Tax=Clostridia TaxID=186801 RepID=UPI000EA26E14|nr:MULTISPECIES: IclR family transcriptional regulator [Clostridia]NBJ70155.1 IclR family transcriptional regulator [Roseburia sp. 1XD42-34]RKI77112.1 IclR family transcriptional regulator [Clostridium sp. 1xD42-85]
MNQSVLKALTLLDLFQEDIDTLSLKEIAEQAGMPKPTTYRLLTALEQKGYVSRVKSGEGGKYRLGLKLLELGSLVANRIEIREIALPYMQALAKDLNEVVHLVIVNREQATYIEKVESTRALRLYTKVGKSVPLYLGSGPKLLLAYLPEEKQHEIVRQSELRSMHRLVKQEELLQELRQIRESGFAYSVGEQDEDTTGVSYPIFNHHSHMIAALAISGLSTRFSGENLQRIKEKTKRAADRISKKLGYRS